MKLFHHFHLKYTEVRYISCSLSLVLSENKRGLEGVNADLPGDCKV